MSSVITSLPTTELLHIARSWAPEATKFVPEEHPTDSRWFVRLYAEDAYEVWLMGWDQEQSTEFHDHGGSSGAVVVAEGDLFESRVSRSGVITDHELAPGESTSFGPTAIHNVYNANHGPSLSVHVYSPPLSTMTYFEVVDDALVPAETIDVDGPEPDGEHIELKS